MVKRSIYIRGIDKELVISKATQINVEKEFMEIERLKDGTYRLIYSSSLIQDFTMVDGFDIIRMD